MWRMRGCHGRRVFRPIFLRPLLLLLLLRGLAHRGDYVCYIDAGVGPGIPQPRTWHPSAE